MEKELEKGQCFFLLAVDENDRILGTVLATNDGRKGWINRLAVDPEMRNHGIARILVKEAEERLKQNGIGIIACLIEDWNSDSSEVFKHLGYNEFKGIKYLTKRSRPDI